MAFSSGDLREHIRIETPVSVKNSNGYKTTEWQDLTNEDIAAMVQDVSARDYYAALAAGALDTVTFTIRYLASVDAKCRVKWQDEYYQVTQVNRLGAKRDYMQLKTKRAG